MPVEQHDHAGIRQASGLLFVTNGYRGGHASHVADLEIDDHQGWFDLPAGGNHVNAASHPQDGGLTAAEGGVDLVKDPVGVGGDEYFSHLVTLPLWGCPPQGQVAMRPVTILRAGSYRTHLRGADVLDIEMSDAGGHLVCRPVGEIDAFTVPAFREALATVGPDRRLIIDLGEVPFMDSAGLGALIGGIRRIREIEGEVAVVCSRPTLLRLLHTTGFDRIVPVVANLTDAVDVLAIAGTDDDAEQ